MTKFFSYIFLVTFCVIINYSANGQCNPAVQSGRLCINTGIQFVANAPGFTSFDWTFGSLNISTGRDPLVSFNNPGTFAVKLKASGPSGSCEKSFSITVYATPKINLTVSTDTIQCFKGNSFCFVDSTISATKVTQQVYQFSDGVQYKFDNPTFPLKFCHKINDPKGGNFNVVVTSTDSAGCEAVKYYNDFITVHRKVGAWLSGNSPVGCDSTKAMVTNESDIDLDSVADYCIDFGDGSIICGDWKTNRVEWKGKTGQIVHHYRTHGTYSMTLYVAAKNGCKDTFTLKNVATNIKIRPKITSTPHVVQIGQEIDFSTVYGPIPGASFLWNFGDPPSGTLNFEDRSWTPSHAFSSLGPKMISLRVASGPCDKVVFDTVNIVGPNAQIEIPYDRISEKEKYQCVVTDTVHFTNNSSFWGNDGNSADEDSTVTINGKKVFAFNYDPIARAGDQTALTSQKQLDNRKDDHVTRLWNFGDKYANQCTTSTDKKVNVGMNCNYSTDEFPVHMYSHWDSLYYKNHFLTNDTFYKTIYANGTCKSELIDTSKKQLHRLTFMSTKTHDYKARLFLKDTVSGYESRDEIDIITSKPDASKMKLISGVPCALDGNKLNYYLTFDMGTNGQSYFAVNFDSINSSTFVEYNSGGILAPEAPGSPIPFILPYDIVGNRPSQFVKGYSSGEIGKKDNPRHFTVGLIVGNGPVGSTGKPTCLDTAWYHNIVTYDQMDASFEILNGKSGVCKGKDVYFKLTNDKIHNLAAMRWNWGDLYRMSGYYEQFVYLEKYTGPKAHRNDKDVKYNGENWYYNYVVRHNLKEVYGDEVIDTIVTAIVKDVWLEMDESQDDYLGGTDAKQLRNMSGKELSSYFGSCIDTTGLSQYLIPREYKIEDDGLVFYNNGKRYRYTNSAKTDSIEVAEILHFRDSSLQGFDTLFDGTDTITGVWKHQYAHYELSIDDNSKRDTSLVLSTGAMIPSFFMNNITGCEKSSAKLLNVGYLMDLKLDQDAVCKNDVVQLNDSIRYWQLGDENYPRDYPIDPRKFWEDPARYAPGNLEIKSVDWDASDGIGNDKQRSINFFHIYDTPGEYTVTLFAKDSMGCLDTAQVMVDITGLNTNIGEIKLAGNPCSRSYNFFDSSTTYTQTGADSIVWYDWSFGDGSVRSVLKNPPHTYSKPGTYTVTLKTHSLLQCSDSVTKELVIEGPQPKFEFVGDPKWNVIDTATIYLKDSLTISNTSLTPVNQPSYNLNWGDNTSTSSTSKSASFIHSYDQTGIYYPNLYMEDLSVNTSVRCFAYYPHKEDSMSAPSQRLVVVVLPDSVNSISNLTPFASVYPNPTTGSFTISTLTSNTINSVELINVFGQSVAIDVNHKSINRVEVTSRYLVNGNYFLILQTDQGVIRKKITVIN